MVINNELAGFATAVTVSQSLQKTFHRFERQELIHPKIRIQPDFDLLQISGKFERIFFPP